MGYSYREVTKGNDLMRRKAGIRCDVDYISLGKAIQMDCYSAGLSCILSSRFNTRRSEKDFRHLTLTMKGPSLRMGACNNEGGLSLLCT